MRALQKQHIVDVFVWIDDLVVQPKKRSKKHPLTKEDKQNNHRIASERVANEQVIGALK
jgi:hypothetical protein